MIQITRLLYDCIVTWLESNHYLISGHELQPRSYGRFDIINRKTQKPIASLVCSPPDGSFGVIRIWQYGDMHMDTLLAAFIVRDESVTIDRLIYDTEMPVMASDPKFFSIIRSAIRSVISELKEPTDGWH